MLIIHLQLIGYGFKSNFSSTDKTLINQIKLKNYFIINPNMNCIMSAGERGKYTEDIF